MYMVCILFILWVLLWLTLIWWTGIGNLFFVKAKVDATTYFLEIRLGLTTNWAKHHSLINDVIYSR
jgi:hypothetical protein